MIDDQIASNCLDLELDKDDTGTPVCLLVGWLHNVCQSLLCSRLLIRRQICPTQRPIITFARVASIKSGIGPKLETHTPRPSQAYHRPYRGLFQDLSQGQQDSQIRRSGLSYLPSFCSKPLSNIACKSHMFPNTSVLVHCTASTARYPSSLGLIYLDRAHCIVEPKLHIQQSLKHFICVIKVIPQSCLLLVACNRSSPGFMSVMCTVKQCFDHLCFTESLTFESSDP